MIVLPLLTRIDHVGIACRDLDRTVRLYQATFGLEVVSLEVIGEQGVREAMLCVSSVPGVSGVPGASGVPAGADGSSPGYIQLLEPLADDTPVGRFLARRGEGIHHIGYAVADIGAALAEVGGTGVRLIDERPRHGSMGASIAFLHPADLGGVLTELVQPVSPA
jgi:methylmalonyl-CoA/ethylmalonyl-CoA epimerase